MKQRRLVVRPGAVWAWLQFCTVPVWRISHRRMYMNLVGRYQVGPFVLLTLRKRRAS